MRIFLRLGLVLGIVGGCALSAEAADGTRGDIAGGYSYMYDSDISESFPAGWFFSGGANITDMFAVVGDVSGSYKSTSASSAGATASASLKVHTFLAGPRVMGRSGRVTVFGQFLVGAATASAGATASGGGASITISDSTTDFCYAPGGGVDIELSNHAGIRVGATERLIRSGGQTSKEFQLVVGAVYRFGK